MARFRPAAVATIVVLIAVLPGRAAAQHEGPDAAGHAALLATNALIGGLAGGIGAWVRGEDVPRAFLVGVGGGSVGYVGKAVVTARFAGAPIAGRQLAAVGHSVIANAAAGRAPLAEVWLPISPFRLRLPLGEASLAVQLDVADASTILYAVLTPELAFDVPLSVRQGTPVFVARGYDLGVGGRDLDGAVHSGVIFLSGDLPSEDRRRSVLAHEQVHILQGDFAKVAISYPVERWALRVLTGAPEADPPVQGGFFALVADWALGRGFPGEGFLNDLTEGEARALVRRVADPVQSFPR